LIHTNGDTSLLRIGLHPGRMISVVLVLNMGERICSEIRGDAKKVKRSMYYEEIEADKLK
jgi:hypothetical protein